MRILRLDAGKLAALLGDGSALPGEPSEMIGQLVPVLDILPFLVGAAEVPLQEPVGGTIRTGELWAHGGNRVSGAGGAGQFSGLGDTYEADAASARVTKLQIVAMNFRVSVDCRLRLYYETVDVFVGAGDLGNLADNRRSNTDNEFGFIDWAAQTPAPDTIIIPNHSGRTTRVVMDMAAAGEFDHTLIMPALFSRDLTAQNQAMGWGVWAATTVTAITCIYRVIVRKLP